MSAARETILKRVREALDRLPGAPAPSVPETARVSSRSAAPLESEITLFCDEIRKLKGEAKRLPGPSLLAPALAQLVRAEQVKRAVLWTTPEMMDWGIGRTLEALGVAVISAEAGPREVASCELGVTGADGALAETGTLLLHASPERPRVVSLLPRVHLAILTPKVFLPDLHQALAAARDKGYSVFVTGPSRTADIELTLTLGVHGPKTQVVWVLGE
jgi:L-lactate dehydrogenase complex protein LldG